MEPRRWRPIFYNPFTERKGYTSSLPIYRGYFRLLPLNAWRLSTILKVLDYAGRNPTLFGLPERATCIVNTAYFLPSHRSLQRGAFAFGTERGCKSIVIPASCSAEPFDALDAKLIEPLFRWNPGVEYVYLSQHCQPMAAQLAPLLSRCHQLREVTLEGWNDAVAIHRVMLACKQVDVLDTYSIDDPPRTWRNELSVQALCTLIEMHPRLRAVKSHRLYLGDWYTATLQSRCKHNVALIPFSCDFVILHYLLFLFVVCVPAYGAYRLTRCLCRDHLTESYERFWAVIAFAATVLVFVALDQMFWPRYGRAWVHLQTAPVLFLRRLDTVMNARRPTALTKV